MGAAAVFRPDSWEILHDIVQILFFFFLLLPNSSGWRILDAWLQLNLSSTWRSRVSPAPPPRFLNQSTDSLCLIYSILLI